MKFGIWNFFSEYKFIDDFEEVMMHYCGIFGLFFLRAIRNLKKIKNWIFRLFLEKQLFLEMSEKWDPNKNGKLFRAKELLIEI